MRAASLLCVLAACGTKGQAHVDAKPCAPATVFLDRNGGSYDHGLVDDATINHSVLFDQPRVLPPWPYDDVAWGDLTSCIRAALAPFAIDVTEIDPGVAPHVEIVFTTSYWGGSAITSAIPSPCRPGYQVELVFGDAISTPTRACEVAMAGFAQMTALLGSAQNCLDFTSPARDCGVRFFLDLDQPCIDDAGQVADCRCGGATQNTFEALQAQFPACPVRD